MADHTTTAHGLTMEWSISRGRMYNAANPFTLWGYVNGECRMQCAISAQTARSLVRCERAVTSRLAQIAAEVRRG